MQKQGLSFLLSTQVLGADIKSKQVSLTVKNSDGEATLSAEVVLVAVGRRPYSRGLGLDGIGIQLSPQGFVLVDGLFRTAVPHIYAIGDLIEGTMLAHRSSDEGIAAAEVIAGKQPHVNYMAIPNVIYTDPEVAAVGLTEQEAKDFGLTIKVGTAAFKGNPRARCMGEFDGMVKVIGEAASDRLIGMHIIGPQASEMIAEGMIAIGSKATLAQIAHASHPHPTLTEAIKEAAVNSH